ncbi:hypothetical protein [uncultured Vagococcus sp.]|uniref:hypothetical protein n=1 Tax=uncultured Vagococcus sp. TaxID=189676 RepID=UPI0028D108A4|nr:hypothetical protein [uncultured Vagococcus sp.]
MKIKKVNIWMTSLLLMVLLMSACGKLDNKESEKYETTITNSSEITGLTEKQEDAIENGFQVDEYTVYLTEENKQSQQDIENFIESNFYEKNVLQVKDRIDKSLKVNILTYAMNYSPEEERYTLGVFFINTSQETMEELAMTVRPIFKNVPQTGEFGTIHLKGENFVALPTNGIIVRSFSADAPIEFLDQLKQNKGEDITFEIKDLEINGEKVNNSNE